MKTKKITVALLLVFLLAGCARKPNATVLNQESQVCFTALQATRAEITQALLDFYDKYPENRIDFKYLEETGMMNLESMNWARGNPIRTDSLERDYFNGLKDHLKPDGTFGERWQLKTSDGKIGYGLTMEFCDETNNVPCNLCLVGQLPKADLDGSRKGNLYFRKRDKRQFVAYLEKDLIEKLKVIIVENRQKK